MDYAKQMSDHYRRWNIANDSAKDFCRFKDEIIRILDEDLWPLLCRSPSIDKRFCRRFDLHKGSKPHIKKAHDLFHLEPALNAAKSLEPKGLISRLQKNNRYFGDTSVYRRADECRTTSELATVLQILFLVLAENADENQSLIDELAIQIKDVADLVPSASFQIGISGKQVIIYPRGDDLLDQGIINCVLAGLENFPQAAKPFANALNIYQSGQLSQYRNLLDDLRLSLETLLKKVLNNQKSLENQEQELLRWLKGKQLHQQIVNLYKQLLFGPYRIYQNDAVKHGENYSLDEVEFAIYLTGNFMRFILQLHGE